MNGRFRIILADGNRYVREFFKRELEEHGFEVIHAADYQELFRILSLEDVPDLLVLDLNLPYAGGINVLLRLQQHVLPMPVVVCSSFTEFEHHPVVEKADAFVEKDGNPEEMIRAINEALKKYYPARFQDETQGEKHTAPERLMK